MLDIKKLKEFKSAIEKISDDICNHATTDLKVKCYDECPYWRLCELLTCAKGRALMMEHRPDNPNFTKG